MLLKKPYKQPGFPAHLQVLMPALLCLLWMLLPGSAQATQLHASAEGIITHQVGHAFFLFSMVVLFFMISGKGLDRQKGWRLIRYSAFFFILWNLDAITAHFFDNQINIVKIENISLYEIKVVALNDSPLIAGLYYILKLDHLLCVPAILCLYLGLSSLVSEQRKKKLPEGEEI